MEALMFRDMEGNLYAKSHVDKHHVIPQCRMNSCNERQFVNLSGLVVPILKTFHNDGKESLHAQVPLAPKPVGNLMYLIRMHIYEQDQATNTYDRFLDINDYIHNVAETTRDIGMGVNAGRIARNFELQIPFILSGMVERVDDGN